MARALQKIIQLHINYIISIITLSCRQVVMSKTSVPSMRLNQIIEQLQKIKGPEYVFAVSLKRSVLLDIIASLSYYKENYAIYKQAWLKDQSKSKDKPQNKNEPTLSQQIQFYSNLCLKIANGKPLEQIKPKDCGELKEIAEFYINSLNKVNECYRFCADKNQGSPGFWVKVQKCIDALNMKVQTFQPKHVKEEKQKRQLALKCQNLQRQLQEFQTKKSAIKIQSKDKISQKQTQCIKELQSDLINLDTDYERYKKKETEFASYGVPPGILNIIQDENQKWFKVYNSLIKNIYVKSHQVEGDTLADKCQKLCQQNNYFIEKIIALLCEEIGDVKQNYQLSFSNILKMIRKFKQKTNTFIAEICTESQKKHEKQITQIQQKYKLQTDSIAKLMNSNSKMGESQEKLSKVQRELQNSLKREKFFKDLALQNYSYQQISEIQSGVVEQLFTQLHKVYFESSNYIIEEFSEDDSVQKKRQMIIMMLKLTKGTRSNSKISQPQIKVDQYQMLQESMKPNRQQNLKAKNLKIFACDNIIIKEELDQAKSINRRMDQVQDHNIRSNSSKKPQKQLKQLREKVEKYENSIKTLKNKLQQKQPKNGSGFNDSKTPVQPESDKNQLARFQQLKQAKNSLKNEISRSNQLAKANQLLLKQIQDLKLTAALSQKKISNKELRIRNLEQEIEDFIKAEEKYKVQISQIKQRKVQVQDKNIQVSIKQQTNQSIVNSPYEDSKQTKLEKEKQIILQQSNVEKENKTDHNDLKQNSQSIKQQPKYKQEQKEDDIELQQTYQAQLKASQQSVDVQNCKESDKTKEVKNLDKQIQQLKQKLNSYAQQVAQKQEKLMASNSNLIKLDQLLLQKNSKAKELAIQIAEKEQKTVALKQELSFLKTQITRFRKRSEDMAKGQKTESSEVQKGKNEIKSIQENIKKLLQSKNKVERENLAALKNCAELAKKQKALKQSVSNLETRIENLAEKQQESLAIIEGIEKYQKQYRQTESDITALKQRLQELKSERQNLERQVGRIKLELANLEEMKSQYANVKANLQKLLITVKSQQRRLQEVKQQADEQKKRGQIFFNNFQSQKRRMNNEAQLMKTKAREFQSQVQMYQQRLKTIQQSLHQKRRENLSFGGFANRFFVGQIIKQQSHRQYIIDQVERIHKGKEIGKTKFLFSFPLMKDLNPHLIIDEVPNYIFLVKCPTLDKFGNNYVFALYSANPLSRNAPTNNGLGFISAVTNEKTFYLKNSTNNNPRITEYNDFYLIFGNSQIRFKFSSYDLEFNIGHLYRSFNTEDYKDGEIFTGDPNKETKLLSYEVYQILFKGEKQN